MLVKNKSVSQIKQEGRNETHLGESFLLQISDDTLTDQVGSLNDT
jgi:hypothetical protein